MTVFFICFLPPLLKQKGCDTLAQAPSTFILYRATECVRTWQEPEARRTLHPKWFSFPSLLLKFPSQSLTPRVHEFALVLQVRFIADTVQSFTGLHDSLVPVVTVTSTG